MHACMHACIHTYIHTYMHTYIYLLYIPAQRFPPNQIPKESSTSCKTKQEHKESVYGAIKKASRNRMGHAVADKFVYCHEALHLKAKLQSAGYHQGAEKWDTDSDSDETDDEDLKM